MTSQAVLFELSSAQLDIFLDQSIHKDVPMYNIGGYVVIREEVDVAEFERAHAQEAARHDALRLHFGVFDGQPRQYLSDALPTLIVLDFGDASAPRKTAEAWLEREFARNFRLEAEPLHVSALIRVAPSEYWYCTVSHHLVIDGWGYGLWIRRLVSHYLALTGRGEVPPPPARDFLNGLSEGVHRTDECGNDDEARLQTPEPSVSPLLEARTAAMDLHPSNRVIRDLEDARMRTIAGFAEARGFRIHHLLCAAMCVYFASLKRRDELIVGIPAHNRKGLQKTVVGSYVGVGTSRVAIPLDSGVVAVMAQVKQAMMRSARDGIGAAGLRSYGDRSARAGRRFDLQFNYLKLDYRTDDRHFSTESRYLANRWAQVPFSLNICEFGEHQPLQLQVDANEAFFSRAEAERMLDRIEWIVDQWMADPALAVDALKLVPPAEEAWLLGALAGDEPRALGDEDIWDRFVVAASRRPEAIALRSDRGTMDYGALRERAERFAASIAERTTSPSPLGVCMAPTMDAIAVMLAALRLRRPFVMLDPCSPASRMQTVLADAGLEFVLVDAASRPVASALECALLEIDEVGIVGDASVSGPIKLPERAPTGPCDSPAWIIYTSGSTGVPKGVVAPHSAMIRLAVTPGFMQLGPETVMLQTANRAFDASMLEIFGPLLNGGTVVLLEDGVADFAALTDTIDRHGVNALWLTAGLFDRWVDQLVSVPSALRCVLAGGDVVAPKAVRKLQLLHPGITVVNGYGPTENGIFSACCVIERDCDGVRPIPIGRPVPDSTAYVVDAAGRLAPYGEPGELWVGGTGLALGYHGTAAANEGKFLCDPAPWIRGRVYRTGDLVRWREDGQLDYLGRVDQQVKIRGFRIELDEIEIQLRALPGIAEAAVVAVGDSASERTLLAAVRVENPEERTFSAEDTARRLRERLPEYMIPTRIVAVETMPLNANGKVDRIRLRGLQAETHRIAPSNERLSEIESEVLRLWRVALPSSTPSVDEDFFACGGHSLAAMQIVSDLNARFGVELTLGEFLASSTASGQAELIERALRADVPCAMTTREARDAAAPVLSYVQEQMWLRHRLNGGSHEYNVPGAFRLRGALDVDVLEQALRDVIRRHATLACRIEGDERQAWPVALDISGFSVERIDLSRLDESERSSAIDEAVRRERTTSFGLESGFPIRASVLRLASEDNMLLLTMHHIAVDGWSLATLQNEVSAFYRERVADTPANPPRLGRTYADFAEAQRLGERSAGFTAAEQYWRHYLDGAPTAHELPLDKPRPERPSHRGRVLRGSVDAAATEALALIASSSRLSIFGLLQTAFAVVVGEYSRLRDVVVGTPVSGRPGREYHDLIGCFINTLAVRTRYDGDASIREIAIDQHRRWGESLRHHHVPFSRILNALAPAQSRSINPLFQLWFVLHPQEPESLELQGVETAFVPADESNIKFDVMVSVVQAKDGLRIEWQYADELFEPESMTRMLEAYLRLLARMPDLVDAPAGALPQTLGLAESIIETPPPPPYDPRESVVDRVFFHAAANPTSPAVADGARSLDYGQLAARVRRLSGFLAESGVQRNDFIAVCADRSIGGLVAMLAVQAVGAAYVPLDAKLPSERLRFMLEDANAQILLTNSTFAGIENFGNVDVVLLDEVISDDWLRDYDDAGIDPAVFGPDDAAYLIYTSGSTGRPKGVCVTRRNLAHYVAAMTARYDFGGCRRYAINSAFHTDLGNTTLYIGLWHGGCLQLMDGAMMLDGAAVSRCVRENGVDVMKITPGHFAALCDDELYPAPVPSRFLIFGGEALRAEVVDGIRDACLDHGCRVINHYGPTEATIGCLTCEIDLASPPGTAPLGTPLPGKTVRIMHGDTVLPLGAWGELVVSGDAVSRGYLGRDDLTSLAFGNCVDAQGRPSRFYRTGDRARIGVDGLVHFGGRFDDQIKIRGFRVELSEIDACLQKIPGVAQTVSIVYQDDAAQSALASFVVAESFDPAIAAQFLARTLPDYMLPKQIVALEVMPLLGNGKPDRLALVMHPALRGKDAVRAPITPTEIAVHGIISDLLKLQYLSVEQRFFDAGGNSLLVTRLANELGLRLGIRLPVQVLMENHSARSIASLIDAIDSAKAATENNEQDVDADVVEVEI